jgi:diketogulonate reductase-like aldo/keto reductase
MINRIIHSTGETLPVLGLGTWDTFDVEDWKATDNLHGVLQTMKEAGGKLIDSSPMYGNSEKIVGDLTSDPKWHDYFFYATKVWTSGKQAGIEQMESSLKKMNLVTLDLIQIHNLVDWKTHLATLKEWKEQGKIRYIGITHYTDSAHPELERIIAKEKIDFVQFNFSIFSRNAEKSLLSVAADHGVATIVNRPFGTGSAFTKVAVKPLPAFVKEYAIETWSQFFLSYIVSHPAVTVVIPATRNPAHAAENYSLPDQLPAEQIRKKMADFIDRL